MKICVQYSAQLRAAVGRPLDEIELPAGSSLATLLDRLIGQLDEAARGHLIAPGGTIRPSLLIVVGDVATPVQAAAERKLQNGETVLLLPPIAGG
jgi:molybdopterin converting factor small subunit